MIPNYYPDKFIEKYGYKWYLRDFDYYPYPLEFYPHEFGKNQWEGVKENKLKIFDNLNDAMLASYDVRSRLGLETRTKVEFFKEMLETMQGIGKSIKGITVVGGKIVISDNDNK